MKATLTFDLSDPDDAARHRRCTQADRAYDALWTYDEWLRGKIKYDNCEDLQTARDKLHETLDDCGITLDDWS